MWTSNYCSLCFIHKVKERAIKTSLKFFWAPPRTPRMAALVLYSYKKDLFDELVMARKLGQLVDTTYRSDTLMIPLSLIAGNTTYRSDTLMIPLSLITGNTTYRSDTLMIPLSLITGNTTYGSDTLMIPLSLITGNTTYRSDTLMIPLSLITGNTTAA